MFLDITAIQNYRDINTLKKLSTGLDISKVILLLSDDEVVNSDSYIIESDKKYQKEVKTY